MNKYCKRFYPSQITVNITDSGKVKYIHNCYCLTLKLGSTHETALENMKLCSETADIATKPPAECP